MKTWNSLKSFEITSALVKPGLEYPPQLARRLIHDFHRCFDIVFLKREKKAREKLVYFGETGFLRVFAHFRWFRPAVEFRSQERKIIGENSVVLRVYQSYQIESLLPKDSSTETKIFTFFPRQRGHFFNYFFWLCWNRIKNAFSLKRDSISHFRNREDFRESISQTRSDGNRRQGRV